MVVQFRALSIALLCSLSGITLATRTPLYARDDACTALAAVLPGDVAYPNTTAFFQSTSYWSEQQFETRPSCFVTPKSTKAVSTILKTLTQGNWPFTVKSGGHIPFAGGSNIENGVTVDLVHLNDIKIFPDRQTVSVGPGNRWINVTEVLDPLGIAVTGGRDMNVGVSGLILGGGISFFSGQYGWACDNVRGYEVVLASGRIIYASPSENDDLYWALRGGGSLNFGIVTRFDLVAFDQGKIWMNALSFPGTSNATVIAHFQNLTTYGMPEDTGTSGFVGINLNRSSGAYSADVGLLHATEPSPPESIPAVFKPFQQISSATANSTTAADASTFLRLFATPYGRRWTWGNVVISASFSRKFLAEILSLYQSRNIALFENEGDDEIAPTALFQPIPSNVLQAMQKNGGNAFGLTPSDGPLIMISFPTSWANRQNDELVQSSTRKLIADVERKAKEYKVYTPFVYLNYAGDKQEVQKGYGKENYNRLERIARKYDPQGKLAQLWKGYFKLDR
ncbi:FAD-binding domain-containing protein [Amniculicola lignicola CBS 123094]|uniref:FAD-binding domain-containing protein n=1 Tax=Amniculicola lignicola CBS 123094 TaxID=1392246 RepID=A0A6A5WA75_9PLEO|nr:FAD-binding domain-containing protein [Amniculicola lignicola CBS 123094]